MTALVMRTSAIGEVKYGLRDPYMRMEDGEVRKTVLRGMVYVTMTLR